MNRSSVLVAFGISGASALIFEIVWSRYLQILLGSTVYSVTAILAAFLAGFSIGSYVFSGISESSKNPIRILIRLQLSIGLYGLLSIAVFSTLSWVGQSFALLQYVSMLFILFPGILFGATWPVAAKAYVRGAGNLGTDSARLYSLNSLGAFMGPLAAGFLLIPAIGIAATTAAASVMSLLGASVLVLSHRRSGK